MIDDRKRRRLPDGRDFSSAGRVRQLARPNSRICRLCSPHRWIELNEDRRRLIGVSPMRPAICFPARRRRSPRFCHWNEVDELEPAARIAPVDAVGAVATPADSGAATSGGRPVERVANLAASRVHHDPCWRTVAVLTSPVPSSASAAPSLSPGPPSAGTMAVPARRAVATIETDDTPRSRCSMLLPAVLRTTSGGGTVASRLNTTSLRPLPPGVKPVTADPSPGGSNETRAGCASKTHEACVRPPRQAVAVGTVAGAWRGLIASRRADRRAACGAGQVQRPHQPSFGGAGQPDPGVAPPKLALDQGMGSEVLLPCAVMLIAQLGSGRAPGKISPRRATMAGDCRSERLQSGSTAWTPPLAAMKARTM